MLRSMNGTNLIVQKVNFTLAGGKSQRGLAVDAAYNRVYSSENIAKQVHDSECGVFQENHITGKDDAMHAIRNRGELALQRERQRLNTPLEPAWQSGMPLKPALKAGRQCLTLRQSGGEVVGVCRFRKPFPYETLLFGAKPGGDTS